MHPLATERREVLKDLSLGWVREA